MPYCTRCGVEVEPNKVNCPLCNTPIQSIDEELPDYKSKYPEEQEIKEEKTPRTAKQTRMLVWEIISFILFIPLIITLSINLIVDHAVNWALYPISSLLLAWIIITIPLVFYKKVVIIAIGESLPFLVYFLVIDLIDNGHLNWYVPLALPIIGTFGIVSTVVAIGFIKVKNRGLNIPAFILFGVGITCLLMDLIITSYQTAPGVKWSLYVLVPTVLAGGFLLYLHYRVIKGKDLKRKINP
ncbi:MAG TPA: hypothetical protein VMX55_15600 [candidate division Zixibacteria bacterium]|nr:hypothetical protein [candidate division Zixibacteria bacterium]